MSEWISVKDRLPDFEAEVLFFDNCKSIHKGWLSRKSNCWFIDTSELSVDGDACITDDSIEIEYVTHWMPLPEPPKEV